MTRVRPAPLALRRGRAYARDCLGYLVLPAAMLPVGIPLALQIQDPATARAVATVSSAVPPLLAALWAARAESGARGATWGKRRERLVLAGPTTFARALVRNAVKIALPWQLGHLVAIGAASGDFEQSPTASWGAATTMAMTVVLYPLLLGLVGTVVLGSGRGLHDLLAGTRVVAVA
jgi:uncharacterized RDD family membrane protein YckC